MSRSTTILLLSAMAIFVQSCKPRGQLSSTLAEGPPLPSPGDIVAVPSKSEFDELRDLDASIPLRSLARGGQISLRGATVPTYVLDEERRDPGVGIEYLNLLKRDAALARLFSFDVGSGTTLEQHTLAVYGMFRELKPLFREEMTTLASRHGGVDVERLAYVIIALHDIGKPYAIAEGDRSRQHDHTVPLATQIMTRMGYSPFEVELAVAIMAHDFVGEVMKGERPVMGSEQSGAARLVAVSRTSGVDLAGFWALQKLFYLSDALAYPEVRTSWR